MLPQTLLFLFSFLLGGISTAIITCKMMGLPDPRTQGSNNPGATNVLRVGGRQAAIIVLFGDILKGVLPIIIARFFEFSLTEQSLVALSVFLGHVYPLFFGFKGGKGVATFLGTLFAINLIVGLSFALSWLFVAKVLKISSLSALVATLLTPFYFYFASDDLYATYVILIICLWVFYTHRSNIKRIVFGDEEKIKPSKNLNE